MSFTVYSKPGCPYCETIKRVLVGKDLEFQEYILDKDFDKEQFYAEFGEGSTFPQVVMFEKKLGGCTDSVKYLREQGLI
jgi:glutaredoxin 3|tara:strand:+ start:143 stop:379 length:237 start_codon:yes stop_codon:yes gene_type:complete